MSRLEEIKEKYAVQQGFDSWKELWFDTTNFKHANERIDGLVKMYTEECCQASLEKASENIKMTDLNSESKTAISECWVVDKKSITNPENIVLL